MEIADLVIKVAEIKETLEEVLSGWRFDSIVDSLQHNLMDSASIDIVGKLIAKCVDLEFVGSGCTRIGLLLEDKYLIKIFIGADASEGEQHQTEIAMLLYANYKEVPHTPKIYYYDSSIIVMEYIPRRSEYNKDLSKEIETLESYGFCIYDTDSEILSNWRVRDDDSYCLVDWGLTEASPELMCEINGYYAKIQSLNQIKGF